MSALLWPSRRRHDDQTQTRPDPSGAYRIIRLPLLRILLAVLTVITGLTGFSASSQAAEAMRVTSNTPVIDLLRRVEFHRSDGDVIQISTAPGPDGIVRRMAISAKENGTNPDWIVFALKNDSEEPITRWLVAPHFRMIGSGILLPDLGSVRITAVLKSRWNRAPS
jgi:hypothetical protein